MSKIPMKYRKGKAKPVSTVGELIKQLKELPPDMRITHGFGDKVRVVATKYNHEVRERLSLEDIDPEDEQ